MHINQYKATKAQKLYFQSVSKVEEQLALFVGKSPTGLLS